MRVLLTGSTSPQTSSLASRRIMNYPALLRRALQRAGHEVWWEEPSLAWTVDAVFSRFDYVIVGVAPITSLSANRVYGALGLIERLMQRNPKRLAVFVDAPEPVRITAGLSAVIANPDTLVKPFYSYRKEYAHAVKSRALLLAAAQRQLTQAWPLTIVPVLPWQTAQTGPLPGLPKTAGDQVMRLCLDSLLPGQWPEAAPAAESARRDVWVVDRETHQPVAWPQYQIPRRGRPAWDAQVMHQMAHARGTLVHVPKTGGWWSPRYLQSLAVDTPVFGDWRETSSLGAAWRQLPGSLESSSVAESTALAREQRAQYLAAAPTAEEITAQLGATIRRSRTHTR